MKGFRFFTGGFVFVLIFSALAFAQTKRTQTVPLDKIAVINTKLFFNEKTGIKELVNIPNQLEFEFKPKSDELMILTNKILTLGKELKELEARSNNPKVGCSIEIERELVEYDKLTIEYSKNEEAVKRLLEKRKDDLEKTVKIKIGKMIERFKEHKELVIILDAEKLDDDDFTVYNDITEEFIKFYNDAFDKEKSINK